MPTKEKTKSPESKQTSTAEIFLLELENKTIELKIGTHKYDILNILGVHRGVEFVNDREVWYYHYPIKGKALYCVLTFEGGLLHSIKTTHK